MVINEAQLPDQHGSRRGVFGCYLAVIALLCFCAGRGYWLVSGLPFPPYEDSLRDIGFMQGILDGNLFGDPTNAGAWRWYPPLIHFIGAGFVKLTGADPVKLWLDAAPLLNLLAPATFFLMSRRLVGLRAATYASFAFVFLNGSLLAPWDTVTYVPWPNTPTLAQPFFYLSVLVIYHGVAKFRLVDAVGIGIAIGLTFLAHTVPALILVPIVVVAALVTHGLTLRTLVRLTVVGAVVMAFALLMLAPLIVAYRLQVLNFMPVQSSGDSFWSPRADHTLLVLAHLPALIALVALAALNRRSPLNRLEVAILGIWITACLIPLVRNYLCWPIPTGSRRCDAFVIPVQHFHVYLQAAEAIVIGYAVHRLYQRFGEQGNGRSNEIAWLGRAILIVLVVVGGEAFLSRPVDRDMIDRVKNSTFVDFGLYQWISANTKPSDLFVTALPDRNLDPAALSVFMAGRRLVAAPAAHSNPYLDWQAKNRQRLIYFQAASRAPNASPTAFCELTAQAGADASVYVILPTNLGQASILRAPLFQSQTNAVFRLDRSSISAKNCTPKAAGKVALGN